MGNRGHVLVVPFPAQGHVTPLIKVAQYIAEQEVKVTFVNTESIHALVLAAEPESELHQSRIKLVSIPDGLESKEDRKDPFKMTESIKNVMPGHLRRLIEEINQADGEEKISCIIADPTLGWAFEADEKVGIDAAVACPVGVAAVSLLLHTRKLLEEGLLDESGSPLSNDEISVAEGILPWRRTELTWSCPYDLTKQKLLFDYCTSSVQYMERSKWILCNSFYELEPAACSFIPSILPIGPLLINHNHGHRRGSLCVEDLICLDWLDKHPPRSVVYISFGSTAILNQHQFDELANCLLELGLPFLWVVRSGLTDGLVAGFLDGFCKKVGERGKVVHWAPQEKVLAHPFVACFLSHCGWNSTMEGLSNGVPFLCWPYFADQYQNRNYICEVWKVGLGLNPDEDGTVTKQELKSKIIKVLSNEDIQKNSLSLKMMAKKSVSCEGSSSENLRRFIEEIKG